MPNISQAVAAVKRAMRQSIDIENVWFPNRGWQTYIIRLESTDFSVQIVTKALNSIVAINGWKDGGITYQVLTNHKKVLIEKGEGDN